jgi:uncharacterized RDD family membrane protein YckC
VRRGARDDGDAAGTERGARAGAVTRFGAFFADAVVVAVGLQLTDWLLRAVRRTLGHFAPPVRLDTILAALVPVIVGSYLVAFWTILGQTPGKILMGIKVVPLGGGRMTFGRSLVRLAGYLVSALPLYLGLLWMLGPRRRGWHDLLAHTEVRYVRRHVVSATLTAAALHERMLASVRRPAFEVSAAPVRRLGPRTRSPA